MGRRQKAMATTRMAPAAVPEIDMDYDCDVYEPAEDTFLFLDALQDELPFIQTLDPAVCVEIGYVDMPPNVVVGLHQGDADVSRMHGDVLGDWR